MPSLMSLHFQALSIAAAGWKFAAPVKTVVPGLTVRNHKPPSMLVQMKRPGKFWEAILCKVELSKVLILARPYHPFFFLHTHSWLEFLSFQSFPVHLHTPSLPASHFNSFQHAYLFSFPAHDSCPLGHPTRFCIQSRCFHC